MKTKRGFIQKLHDAADGKSKKKAVSPVIATLLLIAIAVAAGIILYVFVSGLTTSLSNVKGTVTQPLQITVTKVVSGAGGGITYQIVNPNGASITSLTDIVTDNNGVQVGSDTPTCTPSFPSAGGSATCTTSSESALNLQPGQTYRITVIGSDAVGNQYSSNPAPFTAK
jgi:flagellin-like protein